MLYTHRWVVQLLGGLSHTFNPKCTGLPWPAKRRLQKNHLGSYHLGSIVIVEASHRTLSTFYQEAVAAGRTCCSSAASRLSFSSLWHNMLFGTLSRIRMQFHPKFLSVSGSRALLLSLSCSVGLSFSRSTNISKFRDFVISFPRVHICVFLRLCMSLVC